MHNSYQQAVEHSVMFPKAFFGRWYGVTEWWKAFFGAESTSITRFRNAIRALECITITDSEHIFVRVAANRDTQHVGWYLATVINSFADQQYLSGRPFTERAKIIIRNQHLILAGMT